jgi:hypothetical protein
MKSTGLLWISLILVVAACNRHGDKVSILAPATLTSVAAPPTQLDSAITTRAAHVQVEGQGSIVTILPDDNDGSPHQRFIVKLPSGHTLLIAHNIDVAPRIDDLSKGDPVSFRGEYVWNEKGGVIHWTHHDPAGRHPAGWIKHHGELFQ